MTVLNRVKPKNVILLKKSPKTEKNLFLLHDGTGRIEGYFHLAMHISEEFNVYGIIPVAQCNERDYIGPNRFSIAEIALKYREILAQFIGDLPIFIAGWSTGGSIAFEMVTGWQKEGTRVEFLGMFDVMPPSNINLDRNCYSFESECNFIMPFIKNDEIKKKLEESGQTEIFWNKIQNSLSDNDWDLEKFILSEGGIWAKIIPNYRQYSIKELFKIVNIVQSYYRAGITYFPEKNVQMPIYYFHAINSAITNPKAWKYFCDELICYNVPGEHYTMLNSQNSVELSKIFNKVLIKHLHNT